MCTSKHTVTTDTAFWFVLSVQSWSAVSENNWLSNLHRSFERSGEHRMKIILCQAIELVYSNLIVQHLLISACGQSLNWFFSVLAFGQILRFTFVGQIFTPKANKIRYLLSLFCVWVCVCNGVDIMFVLDVKSSYHHRERWKMSLHLTRSLIM